MGHLRLLAAHRFLKEEVSIMAKKIRILIVDDEVDFLDSIARRLELRSFDVTKASSGQGALEAAATGSFDLALLDLKMPGMDGTEVLKTLKKEHKYIEVIMLTGHGSINSAVECTKLGAFSYLSKPYELEKLLEVLRDAYEMRLKKKFAADEHRLAEISRVASRYSPETILRTARDQMASTPSFLWTLFKELRKLDDDEK
jgi:DNA-binding NtrC family response regulator